MYLVYCYTNKINGKKYIGITGRSIEEREREHIQESRLEKCHTYNTPFKRAIRKHGIETFERTILEEVETKEEAYQFEIYYIEKCRSYIGFEDCCGYNSTLGGEKIKEPVKVIQFDKEGNQLKIWNSLNDASNALEVSVQAIRTACKEKFICKDCLWRFYEDYDGGKVEVQKNKKFREVEQIDLKGNVVKSYKSISEAAREMGVSPNLIRNSLIRGHKTTNSYWRYKGTEGNYSLESKEIIPINRKKVNKLDDNGNIIATYDSIREAERENNINHGGIRRSIKNKHKCNGSYWEIIDNIEIDLTNATNIKKPVDKLDLNGEIINTYESIGEAIRENGISSSKLRRAIKMGYKCNGSYWRYSGTKGNHIKEPRKIISVNRKPVEKLDDNGNVLEYYNSLAEAENLNNIPHASISNSIKHGHRCHGYYWQYAEENQEETLDTLTPEENIDNNPENLSA